MTETFSLGRIAGIRVGLNWSVLAIFALIAFSLAAGRLPLEYPDRSGVAYAVAGLIAAVIFFASLLAHEVAHAVVARRSGLEVDGITLWLFGGVARLGGEANDPGTDLRISGVGPLVSLALAVVFWILLVALQALGAEGLEMGVLAWLAWINLALAIFNLMPAAPLDGGRILRALLWRRRGDRLSATVTATNAGIGFGWLLVALGLFGFAFTAGFGGLWFVLIGWFLINAAQGEKAHAQIRSQLGDLRVGDVMTEDPLVVPAGTSIAEFIDDYMLQRRYTTYPVVGEGQQPVGLVTFEAIRGVPRDARAGTSVMDVAASSGDVATVRAEERLADVLPRMQGAAGGRLLVVDGGRLVGIVSPRDVAYVLQTADLRDDREAVHV